MRESSQVLIADTGTYDRESCVLPKERAERELDDNSDTRCGLPSASRDSLVTDTGSHETAIDFPVEGLRCTGVLHIPDNYDRCRPLILLLPQGMNLRTGWNRLYVKLARSIGQQGWASLRFDSRGLGNSEGTLDIPTGADMFQAIAKGMHCGDTSGAIRSVRRMMEKQSVILAGVCGGAVTAAMVAAEDELVAGIALLELPLTYPQQPTESEAQPIWRYREKILSIAAWRRALRLQIDYKVHLRSCQRAFRRCAARLTRAHTEDDWLMDRLGPSANIPLVSSVKACCGREMPILCVFGSTDNAEYFDSIRSIGFLQAAAASGKLSRHVVEGADHDFLLPQHSTELIVKLEDWLAQRFLASSDLATARDECHR